MWDVIVFNKFTLFYKTIDSTKLLNFGNWRVGASVRVLALHVTDHNLIPSTT